jgi:hypothetical protein
VYYRGEDAIISGKDMAVVNLPAYVDVLATTLTVHLTQIWDGRRGIRELQAGPVKDGKFTVYGDDGPFAWILFGKRGNINVEPNKNRVEVHGDGPYKYIS